MPPQNDTPDLTGDEETLLDTIRGSGKSMSQAELQAELGLEGGELMAMLNSLSKRSLIEFVKSGNKILFRAVDVDEIDKVALMEGDDRLVYNHIKSAGNVGIWTKNIKMRTNLHQIVVNKSLKSLESKGIIKAVHSIKDGPKKKVYMLAGLTPGAEITGGPWFTDAELDTEFIEKLTGACLKYIAKNSMPPPEADRAVYSTNFHKYPSASQVRTYIRDLKITPVELSIDHIVALLDVLVYDGKIEKTDVGNMGEDGSDEDDEDAMEMDRSAGGEMTYRVVRGTRGACGLAEVPCGQCPVFKLCTDGGLISPETCVYMDEWLNF